MEALFCFKNNYKCHSPFTVCPRSSDPFYIVAYYIYWVTISWTDGNNFSSEQRKIVHKTVIYATNLESYGLSWKKGSLYKVRCYK